MLFDFETGERERKQTDDDDHITVRFGKTLDKYNLHGHLYVICEDLATPEELAKGGRVLLPLRMMTEEERGLVGGKNPELWVGGPYPARWPRVNYRYPDRTKACQTKPGSLLDDRLFSRKF